MSMVFRQCVMISKLKEWLSSGFLGKLRAYLLLDLRTHLYKGINFRHQYLQMHHTLTDVSP